MSASKRTIDAVEGVAINDEPTDSRRARMVLCTDVSSFYPSIIISRNLCPSRLLLDEVEVELSEVAIVPDELRART